MNKIAIVTGGNRGLGKAASIQMAQKGFTVILTARELKKAELTAKALNDEVGSDQFIPMQLDVLNDTEINQLYEKVRDIYGHVDVLINNAGIIVNGDDTTTVTKATLQKTLDTNFFGPFSLSQKMIPLLRKSKDARIINVSSGMGALSEMGGGHAGYRMSKTALNSLTAVMAADVGAMGIKVFAVCPGWVHTDMGGKNAPRTPAEGATSITWLADAKDVINGKFYRDGKMISY